MSHADIEKILNTFLEERLMIRGWQAFSQLGFTLHKSGVDSPLFVNKSNSITVMANRL